MSYLIPSKHSGWTHEMKRHMNGSSGGGGSSGERPATEEEKRLWAAQAASLEQMNQIAMPNLTTGMNNLGVMANETMDGTLAARLRGMAGADASQAMSTGLGAASRSLNRFGSTLNPNALGAQTLMAGLEGAKMKTDAMNKANFGVEDLKWNRNAALTGLASGQGAQAINGMGSLAGQITADRNASNNMAMQNQANNTAGMTGLGMAGAYMMKKDGGEVRLANGGGLQMFRPVSPTTPAPFTFASDTTNTDGPGMAGGVMQVAAPVMATNMAANALDKVGIGAPKKELDGVVSSAKDVVSSLGTNSTFAPIAEEKALEAAGTFGGENAAWAAGELAADAELAGSATTAAATEGFGAALGAAAPWLAGGYALGSMLDLWADGGPVPKEGGLRRKDMRKGGKVNGPGTSVSDSIPARLSDGEYVLNEGAVKMLGKDKLDAINQKGLQFRSEEPKFAMGGLAALGHMARGFVPTAMQLDEQSKANALRQEQLGLMKNADSRAQGQFNVTMEDRTNRIAKEKKISEKISEWVPRMNGMGEITKQHEAGQISDGDFVNALAPSYTSIVNDGKSLQRLQNGNFALTEGSGPRAKYTELSAKDAASMLKSQGMQQQVFQQMFSELAAIDPSYAEKAYRVFNDQLTHSGQRADKAQAQSNWETTQRFNETKHADEMKLRERGLRIQEGQVRDGKFSPDELKSIQSVRARFDAATNPLERAKLRTEYRNLVNDISIRKGKLPASLDAGSTYELTPEELDQEKNTNDLIKDLTTQKIALEQRNEHKTFWGNEDTDQYARLKTQISELEAGKRSNVVKARKIADDAAEDFIKLESSKGRDVAIKSVAESLEKQGVGGENRAKFFISIGVKPEEVAAAVTHQKPKVAAEESGRGIFTDASGNTQLLEPFTRLNGLRKSMQQGSY